MGKSESFYPFTLFSLIARVSLRACIRMFHCLYSLVFLKPADPLSILQCLDTTFNEDAKRARKDNGPENLALLHKFAFNLLKMDTSLKKSLKKKRFVASFNLKYLEEVLRNTKHTISQD
mgnify:CR=1 FL=1